MIEISIIQKYVGQKKRFSKKIFFFVNWMSSMILRLTLQEFHSINLIIQINENESKLSSLIIIINPLRDVKYMCRWVDRRNN